MKTLVAVIEQYNWFSIIIAAKSTHVHKVITNLSAWVEGNFGASSDFNSHNSSQLHHIKWGN